MKIEFIGLGIMGSRMAANLQKKGHELVAPFLAFKKSKIEEGKFDAEFSLRWMHKDLQLTADTAYETGVAMPAGNVVKEIYALAMRSGLGEMDFSAVYQVLLQKKESAGEYS